LAAPRVLRGVPDGSWRVPRGFPEGSPKVPRGFPESSPRVPRGFLEVLGRFLQDPGGFMEVPGGFLVSWLVGPLAAWLAGIGCVPSALEGSSRFMQVPRNVAYF
jgi:hypothetical protein